MLRKLRPRRPSHTTVVAYLGLFVALGTGSAYAADTVFSSDIVDGEVKSVDIGDNEIGSADVKDNTINTFDVHSFLGVDVVDGSLTGADISDNTIGVNDIGSQQVGPDEVINDSLLQSDIRAGAVSNDEVLDNTLISADVNDNSLTGADINESTLNLPQTPTTATFAGPPGPVPVTDAFAKIVGKNLPAGSYAITATANIAHTIVAAGSRDTVCELRNGTTFIGGASDRRDKLSGETSTISLSMNGGAQVPGGGGEVSLWCRYQGATGSFTSFQYGQMMIIRLDGFF
jgi:hypothetical protein